MSLLSPNFRLLSLGVGGNRHSSPSPPTPGPGWMLPLRSFPRFPEPCLSFQFLPAVLHHLGVFPRKRPLNFPISASSLHWSQHSNPFSVKYRPWTWSSWPQLPREMMGEVLPVQESHSWGLPGGPVTKTLSSLCMGPRFHPWSGN